ncbi:MAG: hypothetical protein WEB06_16640 [Actinomycetota bacterium]
MTAAIPEPPAIFPDEFLDRVRAKQVEAGPVTYPRANIWKWVPNPLSVPVNDPDRPGPNAPTDSVKSPKDLIPAPYIYPDAATEQSGGYHKDCFGSTDEPQHQSPYVFGPAGTYCIYYYASIYVYTELYRDRWYGEQFLDSNEDSNSESQRAEAFAAWKCLGVGTYTYRSYSYHEVLTWSGQKAYAYTWNESRFYC